MRRGIVVVAPAWHSCGSYEVFKNQVDTFRSLGYATYFLAVSRPTNVWKLPAGYWEHYLAMTPDLAADARGQTGQSAPLIKPATLWKVILPALAKTVVTWRALPATVAPVPRSVVDFIAGCDRIDIVCNHYFNMPVAKRIKALKPGARLILETHDIQSRQFLDHKLVHPITRRRQTYDAMLAEELVFMRPADILVHLNEDEATEFARLLPDKRHELIFPMVRREDEAGPAPAETVEPFDFLIVMSGNHNNYVSLAWFLENVWSPEFDRKFSLKIVGVIDQAFKARNDPLYDHYQHRFTGRVPSVAPYYRAAGTVLVPIIQGHGISIKTIEAMSHGKPVIGTRGAFRGFERLLEPNTIIDDTGTVEQFRGKMLTDACEKQTYRDLRFCQVYDELFSPDAFRKRYFKVLLT